MFLIPPFISPQSAVTERPTCCLAKNFRRDEGCVIKYLDPGKYKIAVQPVSLAAHSDYVKWVDLSAWVDLEVVAVGTALSGPWIAAISVVFVILLLIIVVIALR